MIAARSALSEQRALREVTRAEMSLRDASDMLRECNHTCKLLKFSAILPHCARNKLCFDRVVSWIWSVHNFQHQLLLLLTADQ